MIMANTRTWVVPCDEEEKNHVIVEAGIENNPECLRLNFNIALAINNGESVDITDAAEEIIGAITAAIVYIVDGGRNK